MTEWDREHTCASPSDNNQTDKHKIKRQTDCGVSGRSDSVTTNQGKNSAGSEAGLEKGHFPYRVSSPSSAQAMPCSHSDVEVSGRHQENPHRNAHHKYGSYLYLPTIQVFCLETRLWAAAASEAIQCRPKQSRNHLHSGHTAGSIGHASYIGPTH